jgi:glycosyltransferase involved in cell wall biosynthesis
MTDGSDQAVPTVSVVIACYNLGHYLHHALNSVLNQSFTRWEAIVVDDGSTDNTQEVASKYTDGRIRYVGQANRGVSAARNLGLSLANGEFVAFLDADDEWDDQFLEVCVRELRSREDLTCVVVQPRFIDETGSLLPRRSQYHHVQSSEFRSRLLEGGFFPAHCILCRAHAVRQVGMFDESLRFVEDTDLWLRILASGGAMATIPESLARYRILPSSASTKTPLMHSSRMRVLSKNLGVAEGDPCAWSTEQRKAYAMVHRTAALGYLQQLDDDTAWHWMSEAVALWPAILTRLDTFYELALGDQPRGYRGVTSGLDIAKNGAELLQRLGALFDNGDSALQSLRRKAYGQAYLALTMLADQAGNWDQARGYMLRAIRAYPALFGDAAVRRRLAKLCAGPRIISRLRLVSARRINHNRDVGD